MMNTDNGQRAATARAPFCMSNAYELHSQSQISVGSRIIRDVLPSVVRSYGIDRGQTNVNLSELTLLDIACGPGQLTPR